MIDGCGCRFMSQRTVCVICVSPSACLALLSGVGVGVGVATILPTEKASVQRPRTNELNSVDNHQGDTILSKSVILRRREHQLLKIPSEVQRACFLFCRSIVCQISMPSESEPSTPYPGPAPWAFAAARAHHNTGTASQHRMPYYCFAYSCIRA